MCSEKKIHRYINRVSGPLIDRFDISPVCGKVASDIIASVEYDHLGIADLLRKK